MRYFYVGLAGAMGAVCRYWLGSVVTLWLPTPFPVGILLINLTGAFLLGAVTGRITQIPPTWQAPLTVGFLGGFTTFSTWAVDTVLLAEGGHTGLAAANVLLSILLGLPALRLGLRLTRTRREETP